MRLLVVALLAIACSPPPEQQADYNELTGVLYALEHRTAEDDKLTASLCHDYEARAEKFRKIRVWGIAKKVDQFAAACRPEPKAKKATGKDG